MTIIPATAHNILRVHSLPILAGGGWFLKCLSVVSVAVFLLGGKCDAQIVAGQVYQLYYTNSFGQTKPKRSVPTSFRTIDGRLFFAGNANTTSSNAVEWEPFVTNGSQTGTMLLKSIRPGSGSDPAEFTKVGNSIFFSATDGTNGRELWKTDGTAAGTVLVKNIYPGPTSSSPHELIECQGKLIFSADDGIHGDELWISDGTDAGTVLLKDMFPGTSSNGGLISNCFNWNGVVYFQGQDQTNNREVWRTDGTTAGTYMLKDINTLNSYPTGFTPFNGALYFQANGPASGTGELWKTDGTAGGTVLVKSLTNSSTSIADLIVVGSMLYFTGEEITSTGRELWRSDGTTAGTIVVKNIASSFGSSPHDLVNYNGTLYFVADDGVRGDQIWRSDGTDSGTVMVHEIYNSVPSNYPKPKTLVPLGSKLLFLQTRDGYGTEWWQTDGTPGGLAIVSDIRAGSSGGPDSFYTDHAVVGNSLYFVAGATLGDADLWRIAQLTPAQMVSPAPGSLLTSASTTFAWDSGIGATQYALWIGNNVGGSDLYAKSETGLSDTVVLPTDGRTIYVTLWSMVNGTWNTKSYTYTAHTPGWHYTKLSQTANAFIGGKRTALPSSAYSFFNYYKGTDNKIWALYYGGGSWNQTALSTTANVSDWLTENTTYNQIYYKGTDNHIWALWYGAGKWNQAALSTTANVAGELQADSGTNFTYYRGTDNNLWVFWYGAGKWNQAALTTSAKVAGDVVVDRSNHFAYYRGTDSQMWVVWYGAGKWNEAKLSTTANLAGNLVVDQGWGTYYQDSANSTWAVWFTGAQWAQTNLGINPGAVSGSSSLYGHLGVIYTGSDGAAHYMGNNGTAWSLAPIGPSGLNLVDTLNFKASEGLIYGRTADGNLGVFYYQ